MPGDYLSVYFNRMLRLYSNLNGNCQTTTAGCVLWQRCHTNSISFSQINDYCLVKSPMDDNYHKTRRCIVSLLCLIRKHKNDPMGQVLHYIGMKKGHFGD